MTVRRRKRRESLRIGDSDGNIGNIRLTNWRNDSGMITLIIDMQPGGKFCAE
jgi:hypothetical protein